MGDFAYKKLYLYVNLSNSNATRQLFARVDFNRTIKWVMERIDSKYERRKRCIEEDDDDGGLTRDKVRAKKGSDTSCPKKKKANTGDYQEFQVIVAGITYGGRKPPLFGKKKWKFSKQERHTECVVMESMESKKKKMKNESNP